MYHLGTEKAEVDGQRGFTGWFQKVEEASKPQGAYLMWRGLSCFFLLMFLAFTARVLTCDQETFIEK